MKEDPSAPLELYISFDSLPVSQVAALMEAMSNIYALLTESIRVPPDYFDPAFRDFFLANRIRPYMDSELCLDFARTGNSIRFRFSGRRTNGTRSSQFGSVQMGAIVTAIGALIAIGGNVQEIHDRHADSEQRRRIESERAAEEIYNQHLDGEVKRGIDRDIAAAQVDRMKATTELVRQRGQQGKNRPPPRNLQDHRVDSIVNNVTVINQVLASENINDVAVNGLAVKQKGADDPGIDEPAP
jgi:hypothetical protein